MKMINGKVEGIFYTPEGASFSSPLEKATFTLEGMIGDKHSGLTMMSRTHHPEFSEKIEMANTRQLSIMSVEELFSISKELGIKEIKPEWMSANLLLSGIPNLSKLPTGTRLHFSGGLIIYNEGQNFPCKTTARIVQEQYPEVEGIQKIFIKTAMQKRGLIAWVEHPSELLNGADCFVELPPAWENLWEE